MFFTFEALAPSDEKKKDLFSDVTVASDQVCEMTTCLIFPLPAVSDNRSSHESLWECHTTGINLGTDGISGEDSPALLSRLQPLMGGETNGIDSSFGEIVTLAEDGGSSELEEERSPVEEAGHEVEGIEVEELGSTVEEGEEAALALGVPNTESELPWLQIKKDCVHDTEVGQRPSESQNNEVPEHAETSVPESGSQTTEVLNTGDLDIHCQSSEKHLSL